MDDRLPVNILTGFLGSGKTTLLNRLLRDPVFADCAVLINEFGEVGLDHHLVESVDGDILLLQSGCICCTVRSDLAAAMRSLWEKRERGSVTFARMLIETTGLADPVPVLATVMNDMVLRHHLRPGNVICTVDAVHATGQLARHPASRRQVALADRLVLTKSELAGPTAMAVLDAALGQLNPVALSGASTSGSIVPGELLGEDAFDESAKSAEVGRWLRAALQRRYFPVHRSDPNRHGDIESFVLRHSGDIDWMIFSLWLSLLLHRHGERVLRVKGLLQVSGAATPVVIHGVQQLIHPPRHLDRWPSEARGSWVVFIVDGLAPAKVIASWEHFHRRFADHRPPIA